MPTEGSETKRGQWEVKKGNETKRNEKGGSKRKVGVRNESWAETELAGRLK